MQTGALSADLAQAQMLLGAGRGAEAEALCHAALARNTADASAWQLLGVIALQAGNLLYAEAAARRHRAALLSSRSHGLRSRSPKI